MIKIHFLCLVTLLLLCCLSFSFGDEPNFFVGKVVSVLDGDTIKICDETGNTRKIRMYAIDAPEKKQRFGKESKKFLEQWIRNKQVIVIVHNRGRWGREIGTIFFGVENVNKVMVESGNAWCYVSYCSDSEYVSLEIKAKKSKDMDDDDDNDDDDNDDDDNDDDDNDD